MDDIRKVVSFDSVEEFWGLYNNIVPPSLLPGKANYYLFKVCQLYTYALGSADRARRTESCLHGRILRTRMEVNGLSRCPETRPRLLSTRCGCIP